MGKFIISLCFLVSVCSPIAPAQVPMTGPVIPEQLRMMDKKEYSSITIAMFMEKCINSLYNILYNQGINPVFAKQSSYQICGCAMDQTRLDMPEDAYLDMFTNRRLMGQAMLESSMKMCGEMYGKYYDQINKTQQEYSL